MKLNNLNWLSNDVLLEIYSAKKLTLSVFKFKNKRIKSFKSKDKFFIRKK